MDEKRQLRPLNYIFHMVLIEGSGTGQKKDIPDSALTSFWFSAKIMPGFF
jgi:hypothetical protein